MRLQVNSGTPETFRAVSLLLVVSIAALMQWVGLLIALGAFLADILLVESEYRRELETDTEPFKALLLGFFHRRRHEHRLWCAVEISGPDVRHPGRLFGPKTACYLEASECNETASS